MAGNDKLDLRHSLSRSSLAAGKYRDDDEDEYVSESDAYRL